MTDPQFAAAIDFTGLTKSQLLTMAGYLADRVEGYPVSVQKAVLSGVLTPRQANVLDAVRAVRGDAWAEQAALTVNISPAAVDLANQVKDWVALNKGATETEIRQQFPAIPDDQWTDIKRFLVNSKLIQQAFR
jgi:hypothetical protein